MPDLTTTLMLAWLTACAKQERVNPAFAAAVFHIESRDKHHEFRFGPLGRRGKYIGPAGINRCYRSKWDIDDWKINVLVGVRALKGRDERKILKRYNAACDAAYVKAVMAAKKKYQQELKKEDEH